MLKWKKKTILLLCVCVSFCISCASAPEKPMVVTEKHDMALSQLENGNTFLASGDFASAEKNLNEAYRIAVSIDDSDLITRILYSLIVYQTSLQTDTSYKTAVTLLSEARRQAAHTSRAQILSAVCDVYEAHILICSSDDQSEKAAMLLNSNSDRLSKEPFYSGFLYHTLGDALIKQKKYEAADTAYQKAAEIHIKYRFLQEIGHDWYASASARSLAGKTDLALASIEQALEYDRNAENTVAIASDYFAAARILRKSPDQASRKKAAEHAEYAALIYQTVKMEDAAHSCLQFAASCRTAE